MACSFDMLCKSHSPLTYYSCGSFQTSSNLSIPLRHWSIKPKIVFCVFSSQQTWSGLGWWVTTSGSFNLIMKRKNPGNETFTIYLDSFTRHILFLPHFFRLFHRNAMWVALFLLWGWVPVECHIPRGFWQPPVDTARPPLVLHLKNQTVHFLSSHLPLPLAWYLCLLWACFLIRGLLPVVGDAVWTDKCVQQAARPLGIHKGTPLGD